MLAPSHDGRCVLCDHCVDVLKKHQMAAQEERKGAFYRT